MTPAFCCSIGHFVKAIDLLNKVEKSLKDVGGDAEKYQGAVIELENLATALSHLEALQPDDENVQYVNAIRAMAMPCMLPLQEFMKKTSNYKSFLRPSAKQETLHTGGQKAGWQMTFVEEVEKLRAFVMAKHTSINLLLSMQTSQTLAKRTADVRKILQGLHEKTAEHDVALLALQSRLDDMDRQIQKLQESSNSELKSTAADIETNVLFQIRKQNLQGVSHKDLESTAERIETRILRVIRRQKVEPPQSMHMLTPAFNNLQIRPSASTGYDVCIVYTGAEDGIGGKYVDSHEQNVTFAGISDPEENWDLNFDSCTMSQPFGEYNSLQQEEHALLGFGEIVPQVLSEKNSPMWRQWPAPIPRPPPQEPVFYRRECETVPRSVPRSDGFGGDKTLRNKISPRSHHLYELKPCKDGTYKCAYVNDGVRCIHQPFKLKL